MKARERPILFSGEMVRAILDGRKTQTRRVVKLRNDEEVDGVSHASIYPIRVFASTSTQPTGSRKVFSPFGMPGDRLWVRETWAPINLRASDGVTIDDVRVCSDARGPRDMGTVKHLLYRATAPAGFEWNDSPESRWRPSIFMPRWASRITLEIEDVRVERLQDISYDDCRDEGAKCAIHGDVKHTACAGLRDGYAQLWDRINGDGAWGANPWVWVVEFKRVDP